MDECPHCGCRLDDVGEWFLDTPASNEVDGDCPDCGKPIHVEIDCQYIITKGTD